MKYFTTVIVLFFTLNLLSQNVTHEVKLKNGEVKQIEVFQKTSKKISYWTSSGKKATISMEDVEEIKPITGGSTGLSESYVG
jgi:isopentenyl diphosphate isomerase/L-lactate dehydrogenase-like FMN-dependent dehydrogenase